MKTTFPIDRFALRATPFYFYDMELFKETIDTVLHEANSHERYVVHYAVKANANPKVLRMIARAGIGADCVSGGEIRLALENGFEAEKIAYAGVGKADWEIQLGIEKNIGCFNVESIPELKVLASVAKSMGKVARVALRINPNVGAHTHDNIATGRSEDKFGIDMEDMEDAIHMVQDMDSVNFIGLHFHIGSQLLNMTDFVELSERVNKLQDHLEQQGIVVDNINVGGGLGVSYTHPDEKPIAAFKDYFDTFATHLHLRPHQKLHFEIGRALVAQCGSLISRVLYIKEGKTKKFCIIDAGMNDLIRPALYDAHHTVENLSHRGGEETYDVVGPICESSDVFGRDVTLGDTRRGDLLAIRSAGAYGESMASTYNCRPLIIGLTSEEI